MKRTIIVLGTVALIGTGNSAMADEPDSGHTTEVTPGDWDDDDPKLNFNFQDIPQSKYSGLRLTLTCGLPEARILYTTDPNATRDDEEAWKVYTEPLELTEDCTVRFFARCEGYNDSDIQAYTFVFADHQATAPQIAPDMDRTRLMMTCETPGAAIRYTTDGSEPTSESALYEGPVELTENCVFRARSFADEMFDSEISEYAVDFLTAGLPQAAFENRALVLTAADSSESVYFTTDPDATAENIEAWTLYTAPIALSEDCTVRYFGRRKGYNDSETASFSFVFTAYQTAAPVLTADSAGTHVVMECDTEGAEIRYTTDGSEPTAQSTLYTEPVEITGNDTFRARAFKDGLFDSNTVDFIVMHMAVPSPTAAFEDKRLVLSCADPKARIMYTFDTEATPDNTGAWSIYEGPIALTENCTVRFYGQRDSFNDSDIQSFVFIYSNYRVADPTIERNAEGTHIVMETATEGAEIRYTTDGSEPTADSALYTEPIAIEGNFTFSAIAIADGLFDSKVNRYVVTNMAAPNPTATFENLRMILACGDPNAAIWYTTDTEATTDDTSAWQLYSAPLEMTGDCTLRFFSRRENFNDSDIESLTFIYSAYQAQAPTIERNDQGTHIEMSTAVEGGKIHYTTDGSEPTIYDALYEKPVRIQEGAIYRAKVFADNMYASEISEYIIGNNKLAVPTAEYHDFTLVLSTTEEGASIWYTTDPELTLDDIEAWTPYEGPIALSDDCTYRFFAGDDDANASDVQSFVFQKSDWQAAVPTIERDEEGTHIVMECPSEGAEIRYTTDGSEPTAESTLYTGPVKIVCNGTFRARAFVKGLYDSEVTDFTVANMAVPVAYATFENKVLTLTCADAEAQIWYTNDDDAVPEDSENWQLYTAPLPLTENCYIHFFTRRENFNDSDIETFVFLRANYTTATPLIDRSQDGRSIVMTTETEGAQIRYTTDGNEPTEESELYTEPVFIIQNCTFRARAFADGLFESAISEYSVANLTMMTPYATFENLHLNLSVWDEEASVWYTLDPEAAPEDTEAWTLYTEPIALTEDCTVRFFSRRGGFLDSQIATYHFVYADWQTAAPAITVNADDMLISMECETEEAEIHYTLDGTEPTAECAVYTEPIPLTGNCVIKAVSMKDGMFDSTVSEETVSYLTVADPTATFENLALTLSVEDEYAQILYTYDAEAAVETLNAWTLYTEPLTFTEDCTVRYYACREAYNDSEVMTFTLIYADWQVAAPELAVEDTTVTISCSTDGAEIHYTLDGSMPTAESATYTQPVELPGNCTVKAIALKDGMYDSELTEYTVSDLTVAAPTATFDNLELTLSVDDKLAQILYTTDEEATVEDTEAWTLYTEPLTLDDDCTVHYFARREAYNDSQVMTFTFVYADWQVAAPEMTAEDGLLTITCKTEGAEIHYTLDGSMPTAESATYTQPVELPGNCTVKAIALKDGMYDSELTEYTVSDLTVADPTATFDNLELTLSVDDKLAQILYTTDAEASVEDAEAWTVYTEPLTFTDDCTVRYFARREEYNDSQVMTFTFVYADWQTATPVITADEATDMAVISCETEGAVIRYTLDGSEPTEESEVYTGPIEFSGKEMTIRARAFAEGMYASEISELYVSGTSGVGMTGLDSVKVCKEAGSAVVYSGESMKLPVYTLDGQLIRIVSVEAGRNVIDNLGSGVYVIGNVRIKL